MTSTLVLIPARMAATRLPGKPLADIHGVPMIVHVMRRAIEADIGRVAVATDDRRIADAIRDAGGDVVMTHSGHDNGTSRISEALGLLDPAGAVETIVNIQGDIPTIDPASVRAALRPLANRRRRDRDHRGRDRPRRRAHQPECRQGRRDTRPETGC